MVLSGGGHSAVPVVIAAWLLRVPVVAHEQTRSLGVSNRLIFRCSSLQLASFGEVVAQCENGVHTGPLVLGAPAPWAAVRATLNVEEPVMFVTCGSLGSLRINETIWRMLADLPPGWSVVHQTGVQGIERAAGIRDSISGVRYRPVDVLEQSVLLALIENASVVVSRAGAGTTAALARFLTGTGLVVPLPGARGDEQVRLARALADECGQVRVLGEDELAQALRDLFARSAALRRTAKGSPSNDDINSWPKSAVVLDFVRALVAN